MRRRRCGSQALSGFITIGIFPLLLATSCRRYLRHSPRRHFGVVSSLYVFWADPSKPRSKYYVKGQSQHPADQQLRFPQENASSEMASQLLSSPGSLIEFVSEKIGRRFFMRLRDFGNAGRWFLACMFLIASVALSGYAGDCFTSAGGQCRVPEMDPGTLLAVGLAAGGYLLTISKLRRG